MTAPTTARISLVMPGASTTTVIAGTPPQIAFLRRVIDEVNRERAADNALTSRTLPWIEMAITDQGEA
jgi:hypothetical protein